MTDETGHQILAALEAIKIEQANAKTERAAIRGELDKAEAVQLCLRRR
jgi:hypothetical protein